ncbi:MAG: cation:proton antiporter [Candidatus Thorarchaeota archaeon]
MFEVGPLLIIGAALVLSFGGAALMKRVGIPQILGFMLAGVFLALTGVFTDEMRNSLFPVVDLALGLIGYNIGLEIRKDVFSGRKRQMGTILILESILTFVIVSLLALWITGLPHLAIVFGAVASATDPASTVMVIWERHCKGPLTDTLMFVLALDDVVAIILANISISLAVIFYTIPSTLTIFDALLITALDLILSVIVGALAGFGMVQFINAEKDRNRLLELELGAIILIVGIMNFFEINAILTCMVFGYVVGNWIRPEKDPINHTLTTIMAPIVMIFFVFVGASIDLSVLLLPAVLFLAIAYVVGRSFAKYFGAYTGARMTNTPELTTKYLGLCLMSQAGVAVGLTLVVEQSFLALNSPEATAAGILILNVVALTTMILQVFGPISAQIALQRAGETPADFATRPTDACFKDETIPTEAAANPASNTGVPETDPKDGTS